MSNKISSESRSKFDPKRFSAHMSRFLPVEPFRFLDLPPELRLMVYKYIDIQTKQHVIQRADSGFSDKAWPYSSHCIEPSCTESTITLYRSSLPTAILRTCRLINREAMSVLAPKLQNVGRLPLVFTVDYTSLIALCSPFGPLALPSYPSAPSTGSSPAMFALRKRCQPFLAHKPVCHYPRSETSPPPVTKHPTSIHIVITQHHRHVSEALTMKAFDGVFWLREGNPRVVANVVFQQDLLDWRYSLGNRTSGNGRVVKGLRIGQWEKHLRVVENIRKMAEDA